MAEAVDRAGLAAAGELVEVGYVETGIGRIEMFQTAGETAAEGRPGSVSVSPARPAGAGRTPC